MIILIVSLQTRHPPAIDLVHYVLLHLFVLHEWDVVELHFRPLLALILLEPIREELQIGLERIVVGVLLQEVFPLVLLGVGVDA